MANATSSRSTSNPIMEPGPLSDLNRVGSLRDFISVTKVGITVANLMTVFAGLWLASSAQASGLTILWTLLGTALVIMSGTCLNNYWDRDLDKKMMRTAKRALPNGRLTANSVLMMGLGFAIVGTLLLATQINLLTAVLGLVGLFDYVVIYTMWLKRRSHQSTIWGGISGAMPMVMGWTAITGTMDFGAWALFLLMFLWQPPHFLALAIRRCEDYRQGGIPLLPVVKGFEVTKRQMLRWIAALIPATLLLFKIEGLGYTYLITGLVLVGLWFAHALSGFFVKDDIKWARQSFVLSLIYLTVMNIVIIIEASI
ncbi:MAG TPA: heme o synthase [Bacilli bacterium]|nr:heme o synthase [Bacilli bacterium]